ncbi:MAG: hybrid sensor histidine kinase/response regulator [Sphingobacteriales bacterium 50-39]|nr:MAG: hybrid sensor histidine kinase/response regulator [Sphingobacteriales bacterium 50-39]
MCACRKLNALILSLFSVFVQPLAARELPVRILGIEQGLSNNAVMSICQDHNGFLWIGTYDGLNRWDGYGFKVFHNVIDDSTSLATNTIYSIEEDESHCIWVGGQKGLSMYNVLTSKFSRVRYTSLSGSLENIQDNIHIVRAAGPGCILVATQHNGLLVFKNGTANGLQIPLIINDRHSGNYDVTGLAQGADHRLWVFVQHEGLFNYDPAQKKLSRVNSSIQQANCLKIDRKGRLWLANDGGVFLYDPPSNSYSGNFMPVKAKVVTLCSDKQGVLWIGSDGAGLWSLPNNATSASPMTGGNGKPLINSNSVYTIYEDTEGRKWVGTLRGGINIIDPSPPSFEKVVYQPPSGGDLVDNFILSFCEDAGNVWIGTDGAGLRYWDRVKNSYRNFRHTASDPRGISSNFITSIIEDHKGELWMSTWFGGVNRLNKATGTFERYTCFNTVTNAEENNVWFLFEDSQKTLWAGATNEGSLYYLDKGLNKFVLFDNSLTNLQCMLEDSGGDLWGGNYTTLIKIDRKLKKHVLYNMGYAVRCMHEDRDKNLWIGTQGGGLFLFNKGDGHFTQYTTKDGLPSNMLLQILEDKDGSLWISTFNGLTKFNLKTRTFRNFTQSDGLQSNQFSFNAATVLSTGEFLFGGIKGFNYFFPDSVHYSEDAPRVFLDGVKVNDKPIGDDTSYVSGRDMEKVTQITVPYNKSILSMDFLALTFAGADKVKYAYYLDGWDKNWNYINARTANYSRLAAGSYDFKVKVSGPDGKWGKEAQLLRIIILPPWYQTWWAYCLYAMVFAGSIYLYIEYTRKQERMKFEIKLAHLESEKEKNLSERKLSFFTNISHEFRSPLALIIDPLKKAMTQTGGKLPAEDLAVAHRNARRLLSLVDQLLLFRKADSGGDVLKISTIDVVALCNEVYQCFAQQASSREISYHFIAPTEPIQIQGDYEKIEIALFNLLSNAFKFTPRGGQIEFILREAGEKVCIEIKDTGIGIQASDLNKVFDKFQQVHAGSKGKAGFGIGLFLVKNFIERHKGTVVCKSAPGEGASFTICLLRQIPELGETYIMEGPGRKFELLEELMEEENGVFEEAPGIPSDGKTAEEVVTDKKSILLIDDNAEILQYLQRLFSSKYLLYTASNGIDGFGLAEEHIPDLIISDINMTGMDGIELCTKIKQSGSLGHIPVILLTAATTSETKLKGIEGGADDYFTKPFDSEHLSARVEALLKNRNTLQRYFLDSITLKESTVKVPKEYQDFLRKCIAIIEENIDNEEFTMKKFSKAMGMSHSRLNQKVKAISGQRLNAFIRSIRLRRAAVLMLTENVNVSQAAFQVGINDARYFREQFVGIFGITPSEYIKKYRQSFNQQLNTIRETGE